MPAASLHRQLGQQAWNTPNTSLLSPAAGLGASWGGGCRGRQRWGEQVSEQEMEAGQTRESPPVAKGLNTPRTARPCLQVAVRTRGAAPGTEQAHKESSPLSLETASHDLVSPPYFSPEKPRLREGVGSVSGTQRSEPAGLAPPRGGSLGAGSIVLSPAGKRCAQQPGQRERRNSFGYVTGRPWRLSRARHHENKLPRAAWAGPVGWAPGWRSPCPERANEGGCSLARGWCPCPKPTCEGAAGGFPAPLTRGGAGMWAAGPVGVQSAQGDLHGLTPAHQCGL